MKKTLFAVSIFAALVMSACTPESRNEILGIPEGAILLSTENFTDSYTKTSVDGVYVVWDGDETIDFYVGSEGSKQSRDVEVSGDDAYITTALTGSSTDTVRGYYPAGLATAGQTSNGPRVKTPTEYSSSFSGGRQVLALPMVGLAEPGATSIRFKHLTAALDIKMMNSLTGTDLFVDSVVVAAASYYLNTARVGKALTLKNDNLGMSVTGVNPSTTDADKRVKVSFSSAVKVVDGTSIQVPILPIGIDNITINVYCHSATTNYKYSHTESSPAIARNEMLTARVNLKLTANGGHMSEIEEGVQEIALSTKSADFVVDGDAILTGTPGTSGITCTLTGGTVTLNGVTANSKTMTIKATGNTTLIITGTNKVKGASSGCPAIFVASGSTLTITGTGNLTADGNGSRAAGIGSGASTGDYKDCGNIIITGGTVTANAAGYTSSGAAGIGNSVDGTTCGTIEITQDITTVVAKYLGNGTQAIGLGCGGSCGAVTIDGTTSWTAGNNTEHLIFDVSGTQWTLTPKSK